MNKRTSLIAAAVASVCAAPVMAQEVPTVDVYGRVNVGIQSVNEDGVGVYGEDEGLGLLNAASRVGVMGGHELGDGLTALYTYEFGVDATEADIQDNNRLSWVGLEGDFGRVKAGKMWSAWYTYLGWNTERSQTLGGTAYYAYGAQGLINVGTTTRSDDTVQYTFGGGGYSDAPFTFTVEAKMDGDSGLTDGEDVTADFDDDPTTGTVDTDGDGDLDSVTRTADPQDFDVITLAGQTTIGAIKVNAAYRQASSSFEDQPEPSQIGVGVRWNSGPLYVGGTFAQTDRDTDESDSPSFIEVLGAYDFGDGLSGQLALSSLDSDQDDDGGNVTGVYFQVNQALSEQFQVYVEGQSLSVDGGDEDDTSPRAILAGMRYDF